MAAVMLLPISWLYWIFNVYLSCVAWGEGSNFNGGDVVYTDIAKNAHCKGEIKLAVVT